MNELNQALATHGTCSVESHNIICLGGSGMKKLKNIKTFLNAIYILSIVIILSGCGLKDMVNTSGNENIIVTEEADSEISDEKSVEASVEVSSELSEEVSEDDEMLIEEENSLKVENTQESETTQEKVEQSDIAVTETESDELENEETEIEETNSESGILTSTVDINLHDVDGAGTNYQFTYNGETFSAVYTPDNWKVIDSYKITNASDITIICQALIDIYPVHGSDLSSYRTADDMAYEWLQHVIAYTILKDDDPLKANAKDVDLDPKDQNKSAQEIYKDRTGKDLNLKDYFN